MYFEFMDSSNLMQNKQILGVKNCRKCQLFLKYEFIKNNINRDSLISNRIIAHKKAFELIFK